MKRTATALRAGDLKVRKDRIAAETCGIRNVNFSVAERSPSDTLIFHKPVYVTE